jgi:glutamate/aspartate transport system substrate-binding protein
MKLLHRFVLTLLTFGIAAGVSAQELTGTLKKIKDTGTITIGYRDASIPFSYLDDSQKPIGYSMDLCYKIVDAVKAQLKMPDLKVALQPVTSATRIPLIANGTVDMECGSTTNNLERQQQVSFVVTTFVTGNGLMSRPRTRSLARTSRARHRCRPRARRTRSG